MRAKKTQMVFAAALALVACSTGETATPPSTVFTSSPQAAPITLPPTTTTSPGPATSTTTPVEPAEMEGVVITVEGGLQVIDSFTILVGGGEQMTFDPGPGLLFGGGPLSHLRDHLVSGAPVRVVFTVEPDGTNVAIEVDDAN